MGDASRRFSALDVLGAALALALIALLYVWQAELSWRGAVPLQVVPETAELSSLLGYHVEGIALTWIREHPAGELPFRWGEGVLMLGLDCAAQALSGSSASAEIDGYVRSYYEAHRARGIAFTWSDELTPAIAAASRLARGEAAQRPTVAAAVEYVLHAPRTTTQGALTHFGRSPLRHLAPPFPDAWVDSLFHVVPLLVRHGQLTNASHELDEAAEQMLRFLRAVQDPQNGLVTHAFSEREGQLVLEPPFSADAYWLRGQGWVLASGVEAWAALPEAHPLRGELTDRLQRLARSLLVYQAPSGLFHTLVTRNATYQETAGSALVIYGLARGARVKLLDADVLPAARRGMRGLIAIVDHEEDRFEVTGTSLGTNPWPAIYEHVPTAPQVSYGVGAWLLAACEASLLPPL
jgi:rhamnogalacturonyl hydrolase YesR